MLSRNQLASSTLSTFPGLKLDAGAKPVNWLPNGLSQTFKEPEPVPAIERTFPRRSGQPPKVQSRFAQPHRGSGTYRHWRETHTASLWIGCLQKGLFPRYRAWIPSPVTLAPMPDLNLAGNQASFVTRQFAKNR